MYKPFIVLLVLCAALSACSEEDAPDNLEPRLLVGEAVDITRHEATLSGRVELSGSTAMPKLWFEYCSDAGMETFTCQADDAGDGGVQARITGLKPGTKYEYRLKGSNGRATVSSDIGTFLTLSNDKPTITGLQVLSQGPTSVIAAFEIIDDGGENIMEAGCYIADLGSGSVDKLQAEYSSSIDGVICRIVIKGLRQSAEYELCPYAANSSGETKGEPLPFATRNVVMMSEPGELAELLGDDMYQYEEMTFAGPMNGYDIRCLRRMMGRDVDGSETPGRLAHVDMTDVNIVSGGGSYDMSRYTEDDVIGYGMFADCTRLEEIAMPSTVKTISKDAFRDCVSLGRISIPAGVVDVTPSGGCQALQCVEVSQANEYYSSVDGVLFDAGVSSIVWFPMGKNGDYELPATVTSVGDYAFRGCNISEFVFPDGVTELGKAVFLESKVERVVLPDGLKLLPSATFQDCAKLCEVKLGKGMELVSDYVFDGCTLSDIYVEAKYPPVCSDNAFDGTADDFFSTCVLHVPASRLAMYEADNKWGRFDNIIGIDGI